MINLIRISTLFTLVLFMSFSQALFAAEPMEVDPSVQTKQVLVEDKMEMEQKVPGDLKGDKEPKQVAPPCTCYCLAAWAGPIAAPYVPVLPTTVTTRWFALPPIQTETEIGDEFWNATVNVKTYICANNQVTAVVPTAYGLVHNTYSRSRTRTLGLFGWGAWTAWTPFANTGNKTNAQALATSAPPATPECTTVPIACP